METNKAYFKENLTKLINQIQQLNREFKENTDRLSMDWKDQRKVDFYVKHVQSRKDDLQNISSDMGMVAMQIQRINEELKR